MRKQRESMAGHAIVRTYRGKLLLVSTLITTIALAIIVLYCYKALSSQFINTYSVSMRENMNMLQEHIGTYFTTLDNNVEALLQQTSIQNFLMGRSSNPSKVREQFDGQIQNLYKAHPEFTSLLLYTCVDQTRSRISVQYPYYTYNFMDLGTLIETLPYMENDRRWWDQCRLIPFSNGDTVNDDMDGFFYTRIIQNHETDSIAAIMIISVSYKELLAYTSKINYYPRELLSVVDGNRQLLFHDNSARKQAEQMMALTNLNLFCEKQSFSGDVYYVFSVPIDNYDSYLVRLIPENWIIHGSGSLLLKMVLIGIASIGISLISMTYISKQFSKPIHRLIESMKLMGYGEMGKPLNIPTNDCEIQALVDQFNHMTMLINQLFTESYRLKLAQRTAQLKELQSQINPHFMFNTLQTINYFALEYGANEILAISQALGEMLRYCLKTDIAPVHLFEEINIINRYLIIQKFRLVEGLESVINIDPELMQIYIPQMLLQPIVENAIIHGSRNDGTPLRIHICGRKQENSNSVLIQIYDDGKGIGTETLSEIKAHLANPPETYDGHIGLLNCCNRLRYVFEENASIEIDSIIHEYTLVSIRIPLIGEKP